ncbi:ABC transporter substrate-binding protein [Clostridium oryzae]|uniref:Lipoprotein LipO n=1 Tax=Clostridium oryzae TaxID=1450648 RepID=A0A1V4IU20_9CLOT|nr:ABC transporter substrate-binding protein [Clostridium oryzae]OPJ63538.1 lipoprotein LipO precursor [Clostridium oryzae]
MKRNKIFSLILVTFVTASLMAGCKKSTANNEKSKNDKSPITLTVFSKDVNNNYEDFKSPVAKEITKATGVKLKMEYPVGGNLDQKIGLMIAGNDYPDMIYGGQEKLIPAGAFIKLDNYINKYGKNVKALYGKYLSRLKYSKKDPSIYMLGAFGVDAQAFEPTGGVELQVRAVKEAGYPEIKTLADAEKIIKSYVAKHPKTNGQPTIGLSIIADDWRWQSAVGNMSAFTTGKPDDGQWYVNPDTKEAEYRFLNPDQKGYFKWLNHMNSIGLLDKDSFVQKYDQYTAKISSGRVVALNDQLWQYRDAQLALTSNKKYDETYGMFPAQVNDSTKCADFADAGYNPSYGIGITTSCKNPERAFKFLDWMCSDKAQILNHWGIEGKNYKVVNGKRVIPKDEMEKRVNDKNYAKETGVGVYAYPFPERGDGVKDSSGQFYTPNTEAQIAKNYNVAQKELLKKYNANTFKDLYPKANEVVQQSWGKAWGVTVPSDSDISVILNKCNDITKAGISKAVLASPSNFDKQWNAMQSQLKAAGAEKIGKEFTKLLQDRLSLWNSK